jgi:hypothetical protein
VGVPGQYDVEGWLAGAGGRRPLQVTTDATGSALPHAATRGAYRNGALLRTLFLIVYLHVFRHALRSSLTAAWCSLQRLNSMDRSSCSACSPPTHPQVLCLEPSLVSFSNDLVLPQPLATLRSSRTAPVFP